MTKGESAKTTLAPVFPSYGKNIGRTLWAKHSKIMRESVQFIRTSTVRIKKHVWAGQGKGTTKTSRPPKHEEFTKEERQLHEATHCLFRVWCEICVKAKSFGGRHTEQLENPEHIPVIEFDDAFATDTFGDLNNNISMMIATDSIHGSIFAVVARRKRWPGRLCDAEFPKLFWQVGLSKQSYNATRSQVLLLLQMFGSSGANPRILLWFRRQKAREGIWSVENEQIWRFRDSFGHFEKPSHWNTKQKLDLNMCWWAGWFGTVRGLQNDFQVKGHGKGHHVEVFEARTTLVKVVPFGEECFGRNHSEHEAKMNVRWMRGVFVGKLDRTDEFLLTPIGAMKTRFVRRLEGHNVWDLQFLSLCVGSPWNATAKSMPQGPTLQQKDELASVRRARKVVFTTASSG